MYEVFALAMKDVRLLQRDRVGLFFTFIFPVIYASFFGYLFSGFGARARSAIDLAVIDTDKTPASAALVESITKGQEIRVHALGSVDAARDEVRLRRYSALLHIEPGFGEALQRPFWGEPAKLQLGIDPIKFAEAGMLEGLITQRTYEQFQRTLMDPNVMTGSIDTAISSLPEAPPAEATILRPFLGAIRSFLAARAALESGDNATGSVAASKRAGAGFSAAWKPIEIERVPIERKERGVVSNPFAISFPQGIVWALMSCAASFALSLVIERKAGTLARALTAPLGRAHVLAGKALSCFLVVVVVQVLLLAFAYFWFGVRPPSFSKLLAANCCAAACFVGLMMLLANLGRTESSSSGLGWAVLLMMGMIGGAMVPQFVMPDWMKSLGQISPVYWAILALEGALWRDFSWAQLVMPCAILVAIGGGCFAVGARLLAWAER